MSTKEATLDLSGSRRRGGAPKAGSVWESRMKLDEVKGGFKVFNPTDENSQENTQNTNSTSNLNNNPEAQMDKKVNDVVRLRPKQSPIGMSGKRKTWKSENSEGSPVQIARQRSEMRKNLDQDFKESSVSNKSPVWIKKKRSIPSSDGNEKNAIQLRKVKSDSTEVINDTKIQVKSEPSKKLDEKIKNSDDIKVVDEPNRDLEGYNGKIDKSPDGVKNSRSDEDFFRDGEEKADLDYDDDEDREIEVEKESLDIKEISVPKKVVIEDKKLLLSNERSVLISPIVKKQPPPAVSHARFQPSPTKTKLTSDHLHGTPRSRTRSRLQSFVDLVMWKDVSKSAFIFGIGTFGIISFSYTKDLNISFISVMSYLGLVYLAAVFLFRSLINRGSMDLDSANQDCVVGEEEAIWVVKLLLPYLNEFLLKLRSPFSGDPATTMKLAVFLFILARCGSCITIWKMAKLGFIGVFTVPKICSTYSSHLTAYGTFWIRRFGDAWESCSHKKAVAFAIFTLVWNLSSIVARIWAVFMLFVAFKYYQQSLIREGWANEERATTSNGVQKLGRRSPNGTGKQLKVC